MDDLIYFNVFLIAFSSFVAGVFKNNLWLFSINLLAAGINVVAVVLRLAA